MKIRASTQGQQATVAIIVCIIGALPASSYPEFQEFSEKNSGRSVSCAMCHVNGDGPIGDNEGQIGSLSEGEMMRLNKARAALEPGQDVDSPILNAFGNHIIRAIGKARFLELRQDPRKLADTLGTASDLDGDGIPDSREYLDGTDPLNKYHGDPGLLFLNNLSRSRFDLTLALVAVATVVFGLFNLLKALHTIGQRTGKQE